MGIAWETGLLLGLRDEGVDVRSSDLVVGTSAGSMVGARVAAGHDLAVALEAPAGPLPVPETGWDEEANARISELWQGVDLMTDAVAREIGAIALEAPTCEPAVWIAQSGGNCGVADWPDTDYVAVVVDAASGAHRGIDRSAGVRLDQAIAASCAIPGMFPTIAFDGRHWMDGGVRSGTSADLALDDGADRVLIVAPMCERVGEVGPVSERAMRAEMAQLEAAGGWVEAAIPGPSQARAMGSNLMDGAFAASAREAGFEQGRAWAKDRAADWLG